MLKKVVNYERGRIKMTIQVIKGHYLGLAKAFLSFKYQIWVSHYFDYKE